MNVDYPAAFQVAVVIIGSLGGWFARAMFARLTTMDNDLKLMSSAFAELRVQIATNYVSKIDHKDTLDNIFNAIRRIEEKLDHKADKP